MTSQTVEKTPIFPNVVILEIDQLEFGIIHTEAILGLVGIN
jgi:hypothetical protein